MSLREVSFASGITDEALQGFSEHFRGLHEGQSSSDEFKINLWKFGEFRRVLGGFNAFQTVSVDLMEFPGASSVPGA